MPEKKKRKPMTFRSKKIDDALVEYMQNGYTYTQACQAMNVDRKTVNRWRDKDEEFDRRLLSANTLGMIALNDGIQQRYQNVMSGLEDWSKEQVSAMRDYAQHSRWLSSRLYPRLYGDKGVAQIQQNGNGAIQLAWISTTNSEENGPEQLENALPQLKTIEAEKN